MTGAQALDMMMARMNRSAASLRANCLLELIQYQEMDLEKGSIMPDFLVNRDYSLSATAGIRQVTLPTDFLRELDEDETIWCLDDDGVYHHIDKVDYEDGIDEFGSDGTGDMVERYSLEGLYLYTFPVLTVNRTLKFNYYQTGGTITDDAVETVWLKHASDLLIGGAGTIINALYVKDPNAASIFSAMEQRGRRRLLTDKTAREEAGRDRRMG